MRLFIKNMLSIRCVMFVKSILDKYGVDYTEVEIGEVQLRREIPYTLFSKIEKELNVLDLYFIHDKKNILVEKIKHEITEMIRAEELPRENYSWYLSRKLGHNYTYLANQFSQYENITIEHYIIMQKIRKVKEMLINKDFTISEIANRLNYSSVAHLSSQFKKETGLTPSQFRNLVFQQA